MALRSKPAGPCPVRAPQPLRTAGLALALAVALAIPPAAGAGGFAFDPQGARAAGMAGAFTAQADDPTAIFYNPAGLALTDPAERKNVAVGAATFQLEEGLFQGLPPGIAAGTNGERDNPSAVLPHLYLVKGVSPRVQLGLGVYSPFHLDTAWLDPASFAGRDLAVEAGIETLDVNPTFSCRLGRSFGLGLGVVWRTADVELMRRLTTIDPTSDQVVDFATQDLDTGSEGELGWNLGILHRPSERFSWGLTYRSEIEFDFVGTESTLTQIATGNQQLDDLLAAAFPFGQDLPATASLEFPDLASLGVALGIGARSVLEVDVDWSGWSSVQDLDFDLPTEPDQSVAVPLELDDAFTYRLGYGYETLPGTEFRLGYAYVETPQPDRTVGAVLADANRNVITAGLGRDWLHVGISWVDFEQRIVTDNLQGLNGNHRSNGWTVTVTISR